MKKIKQAKASKTSKTIKLAFLMMLMFCGSSTLGGSATAIDLSNIQS
jgi:hypothetical protein